jgi:hypothetical protein
VNSWPSLVEPIPVEKWHALVPTKGVYVEGERTSWVKIKNRKYSQSVGRAKLFEKRA